MTLTELQINRTTITMHDKKNNDTQHEERLNLNCQTDWTTEKNLHTSDEYFQHLYEKIERVESETGKAATCHFCGFPDSTYLELHHLNKEHSDFDDSNTVLACSFCHRLHHIGWVAMEGLGDLTFFPTNAGPDTHTPEKFFEIFNLIQRFRLLEPYRKNMQAIDRNGRLEKNIDEAGVFENHPINTSIKKSELYLSQASLEVQYRRTQMSEQIKKEQHEIERYNQSIEGQEDAKPKEQSFGDDEILFAHGGIAKTGDQGQQTYDIKHLLNSLYILDILQTYQEIEDEKTTANNLSLTKKTHSEDGDVKESGLKKFIRTQAQGKEGFFAVVYNFQIFEPWDTRLLYTLENRIQTYLDWGVATFDGIGRHLDATKK